MSIDSINEEEYFKIKGHEAIDELRATIKKLFEQIESLPLEEAKVYAEAVLAIVTVIRTEMEEESQKSQEREKKVLEKNKNWINEVIDKIKNDKEGDKH